ncbi:MAG: subclass B1 metallo-beta-lactamase [Sedimentisphaerales bacterium]|nr:subclass B1 metallo-beta-lactamase [Sedimentisphaerales bacterium]
MRHMLVTALLSLGLALVGCQSRQVASRQESVSVRDDVALQPIAPGVWVHTTYFDVPGYGRVGANGLVIVDGGEAALIDLPWTDEQTDVLFDWIARNAGATVKVVVPTHFHQDCMGGLNEAHRRGATSYALDETIALAHRDHLPVPQCPFQVRTVVRCGRTIVLVTYFGAGHTTDNVVAWLPKQQILFAGCLVKSLDAQSLGNTSDGDLTAYPITLKRVRAAHPNARIVVPGHGNWGGPDLIDHTLELCPKDNQ